MAKMNSIWKLVALVCLVACLSLTFVACDKGGETTTTETTTVGTSNYTIRVRTISGVELKNVSVYVYIGDELETMKPLGADGTISFEALTSDQYTAVLMGVPKGYDLQESYALTGTETEIVLTPAVITDEEKPADKVYALGDVMYDFSITASDGTEYTLSQLLQEKDAVVLNFWYLNCTPCKLEFPYLEMAYQEYSDRLEVLAINCEDGNDAQLNTFAQDNELTFPLAIGDKDYWYPAGYTACPTTIVIDRYGTIVYIHAGYFDEVAPFNALFRTVTAEEYEQTFIENVEDIQQDIDERPDGSEERPYEVGGATEFDVKLPANGVVHYNLYRLIDVTMRIENADAYVVIDGVTHYPKDGVIELQVSCEDTFKPLSVAFGNTSGKKNTIHVEFVFAPGNINNPIELVLGDNEVTVTNINGLGCYYTFTATTSGVLTLTVQNCTDQATPDIHLYNENTFESVYLSFEGVTDPETGLTSISIQINEGDRIQIIFSASTAPEVTIPSATILALASTSEGEGTGINDGKTGYSVTVVDQDGNPVPGARVYLSSAGQNASLTTDENGCISIRLTKNAYVLELVVPSGYVTHTTSYLWSPAKTDLLIQISTAAAYTVQVQDESGLPQANVQVKIYTDETLEILLYTVTTDANGMLTFIGKIDGTYYLTLSEVAMNLAVQDYYATDGAHTVITLSMAEQIPGYSLGDVVADFAVTDVDGVAHNLSQLLQENDMVILTFWQSGSVSSVRNLTVLQQIHANNADRVAILALNPVDTLDMELQAYQTLYGLTYPVAKCDQELARILGVNNIPTTVVLDREGRVCLVHEGELTQQQAEAVVEFYTADDYVHVAFESIDALMNGTATPPDPVDPENPDDPENPENPDDPENPDNPEEPEEPEEPVDPEA